MSLRILVIACALLMLVPMAEARNRRSNKIPKSARYTHVTGAKHFKYKSPKKQKLHKHGR